MARLMGAMPEAPAVKVSLPIMAEAFLGSARFVGFRMQ